MKYTIVESPIGDLTLVANSTTGALTGLYMVEHRHRPSFDMFGDHIVGSLARDTFGIVSDQLTEYFAGQRRSFELATHTTGTSFQEAVWQKLREIPYGETISYKELATAIGNPRAVRAAGLANGRNPLSIVVPCHRVIGVNGSLTGFGGGVERKKFLLTLERGTP
jgi:methylated-DNA-[protein]-cysteine S-methyltransferase